MVTITGTNINGEFLTGTADDDVITGLAGADRIEGLAGADQIDGGDGTDTAVYRNSGTGVQVNLTTGFGTGGDAQGDVLIRFENIDGSKFNDTLTGNAGANWLAGSFGSDVIEGGGGADLLDGGILGGADTVSYAGSSAGVTVDLIATTGAGGDAEGDEVYNFQNIIGSAHNDVLNGDNTGNILTGGGGNDTLTGRGGNNTLIGGSGDDTAVFAGNRADATITNTGGIYTVVTADGTHTVQGVEFLRFDDETVTIDATLPAKDINAPTISVIGVFEADENSLANAVIGTVAADDTAVGGTGTPGIAKFEITTGNESGFFAIDNVGKITLTTLGAATTSAANDFEIEPNTFRLSVVATDLDDNKSNTLDVVISVKDDPNDNDIRVTTFTDVVDANDGVTSLREAIDEANASGGQKVVELGAGTYTLSAGSLSITGDVVLRGAGSSLTTINDVQESYRTLNVFRDAVFNLDDVTLTGPGSFVSVGTVGSIIASYELELGESFNVEGGGALTNLGGTVSITNSVIQHFGDVAPQEYRPGKSGGFAPTLHGGALFNAAGSMDIIGSTFIGNKATHGGAIYAFGGSVSIDSSQFDSNLVNGRYQSYDAPKDQPRLDRYDFGSGAVIYSGGNARVNIFADKSGSGTSTNFSNNIAEDGSTVSLIEGNGGVFLESTSSVDGNANTTLAGVVTDTPFPLAASASSALSAALNVEAPAAAFALEAPSAAGGPALLTLLSGLDLSLANLDLALVANAILSQSSSEVVVQLAGHRLVLSGDGLAYSGDPLSLFATSPDAAIAAALGTITGITVTNADGTATVATVTGLSTSFQSVVTGLAKPKADGTYAEYTDTLGVPLSQNGGAQDDTLTGTASVDFLSGLSGNDMLTGAGGNDDLDGGADQDTAAYTGARSDYVVFTASTGKTIVVDIVGARDGKDNLQNVENIKFGTETVTLANALVEPADADNSAFQVYRFYNTQTGSHFFTTSLAERNSVIENLDPLSFEGNSFDSNATEANGTAVFRFFNFANSAHFYTANAGEAAGLRQDSNFRDEGISYYASDDASNGGTELFRFFNTLNGTHFYTVSATERDNIISTLGHYNYEGTAFYVDVA